jgi:dGTPase
MRGEFKGSLIEDKNSNIKEPLDSAYKLDTDIIFNERRKIEIEIGCYSVIGILLNAFCSAVKELVTDKNISFKSSRILEMIGLKKSKKGDNLDLYQSLLKATDYLSGMTDDYAIRVAKRIAGMGE